MDAILLLAPEVLQQFKKEKVRLHLHEWFEKPQRNANQDFERVGVNSTHMAKIIINPCLCSYPWVDPFHFYYWLILAYF